MIRPTAEYDKVLLKLMQASESVFFDLERKVIVPNSIK